MLYFKKVFGRWRVKKGEVKKLYQNTKMTLHSLPFFTYGWLGTNVVLFMLIGISLTNSVPDTVIVN